VLRGGNENQDWLLRHLSSSIGASFKSDGVSLANLCLMYYCHSYYHFCLLFQAHVLGDKFMFFVSDHKVAMDLKRLGSVECKNGTLDVLVKPSPPPKGRNDSESQPGFNKQPRGRRNDDDVSMKEDTATAIQVNSSVLTCSIRRLTFQCVLGTRYNVASGTLNLSNMYNDDSKC